MRKTIRNKPIVFTVMISFVIITVAFLIALVGRNVIIESQNCPADKRVEKLTADLLAEYQIGCDVYVKSWFNESNQCSIVYAEDAGKEDTKILELYINLKQIDIQRSISSLIPELNKVFETDTEKIIATYCEENDIDYETDTISTLSGDELEDIIEDLKKNTGAQL